MQLNRRDFIKASAGLCFASSLPTVSPLLAADESLLKPQKIRIEVGASQPFKAVHVSDSHFCLVDDREVERKKKLAASRLKHFGDGVKRFDAAMALAQKNDALFLHTGDLIDFTSHKNYETVNAKFAGTYAFVSAGNHEYSHYLGEAKEDEAYKAQSFERAQKAFPNDLKLASKVVNGVNFVAFDDVYYYVTPEVFKAFQAEVEKGLPIVALCHVPLHTPELYKVAIGKNSQCAYLTGVPEELMKDFNPGRREQQKPDATTVEFLDWLHEQSLLKAILCGHLHYYWQGAFSKTATQYVVGANYAGAAYEIDFV